jgi:hypothetical protein
MLKLLRNYGTLKKVLIETAPEFEGLPYETLLVPSAETSYKRTVDGRDLLVAVRQQRLLKNGDLLLLVDVEGLPTLMGIAPSWRFHKRKDGSVYY